MKKRKTLKGKLDKAIENQKKKEKDLKAKLDEASDAYYKKQGSFHDNWDKEKMGRDHTWEDYVKYAEEESKIFMKLSREYRLIQSFELTDISDYAHHMTLKEFINAANDGWFIDYDGSGNYATKDKESDITIIPSDIIAGVYREDFTHVVWYNK